MFRKISLAFILLCLCAACSNSNSLDNLNNQQENPDQVIIEDVLVREIHSDLSDNIYVLDYLYNSDGRLVQISGKVNHKVYRGSTYNDADYNIVFRYDNNDILIKELNTEVFSGGATTDYFYNDSGQLIKEKYESSEIIEIIEYSYNESNNLIKKIITTTDKKDSKSLKNSIEEYTYEYDDNNRISIECSTDDKGYDYDYKSYAYCDNGLVEIYYGTQNGDWAKNQEIRYDKEPYEIDQYDECGNLIQHTFGDWNKMSYEYDERNRLIHEKVCFLYNNNLDFTIDYVYGDAIAVENPDYDSIWPVFNNSTSSNNSDDKHKCPACNGTGYMKYSTHGSDLEAILNGYDSWYYFKCTSCEGRGYYYGK